MYHYSIFLVPTEHGSEKKVKSKEFIDTVSESEDSSVSDQEEEEDEEYIEESEEATTDEEGSDDNIEDDSGDDESPPVRSKSDSNRPSKSRQEKEDAKKTGLKRKAEEIRDGKVKKIRSEKKTAASSAIKSADNKGKRIPKKSPSEKEEIKADPVKALPKKESKKEPKKTNDLSTESGEKTYPLFEEKNIDYNFVKNSSMNVVQRRCQIAPNIILQCKNVEFTQNGQQIDFASLTFSRKTKNGRAFDYNMPLSLAPVLIEAVQQIINDNAKFFASIQKEREKN